jgi:hypothetical protein
MENNTSTTKFKNLNFNLKKIIFSFLKPSDQRTIYWINKKLRPLLPDSPIRINIDRLKKYPSYQLDERLCGILELNDGTFACWATEGMKLLKISGDSLELELIKSFPFKAKGWTLPIKQKNENIIFRSDKELTICDKEFVLIEKFKESNWIQSLCKLSELSFAVGLLDGTIKIY